MYEYVEPYVTYDIILKAFAENPHHRMDEQGIYNLFAKEKHPRVRSAIKSLIEEKYLQDDSTSGNWYLLISKGQDIWNKGGFKEELNRQIQSDEIKQQIDSATLSMAQSVIDTNNSVIATNRSVVRTNKMMKVTNILMTLVAAITGVFVALQFFRDGETNLQPINTQLERTAQILDSMRKAQTKIGSSLETMAGDSSSKK